MNIFSQKAGLASCADGVHVQGPLPELALLGCPARCIHALNSRPACGPFLKHIIGRTYSPVVFSICHSQLFYELAVVQCASFSQSDYRSGARRGMIRVHCSTVNSVCFASGGRRNGVCASANHRAEADASRDSGSSSLLSNWLWIA
jgi:hypothetical protein